MYYYIYPFIYKKIDSEYYCYYHYDNKYIRKSTWTKSLCCKSKFTKFMSLDILVNSNYILENNDKKIINEYLEYFIKENQNG